MLKNEAVPRLRGEVAIVTGGTGGIGRATVAALIQEGAHVAVVGRTPDRVDLAVAELKAGRAGADAPEVFGLALDVRSENDMEAMARKTIDRFGRIDILVTCAGLGRPSQAGQGGIPFPVAQLPVEAWDEMIDTNLKGIFLSNRAVLETMMARRRGQIINISSARGAVSGQPYAAAYCASKFGLMGLTEALAEEVRAYGIRVQTLLPDAVHTPLLSGTTLAPGPGDALPAPTVADFIVTMLTLPEDTILVNPLIAPFRSRRKKQTRKEALTTATRPEEGPHGG
jgi:NAD(P)-dependent dehydrogenase (short-subunit alcohol dehydrogenase family)